MVVQAKFSSPFFVIKTSELSGRNILWSEQSINHTDFHFYGAYRIKQFMELSIVEEYASTDDSWLASFLSVGLKWSTGEDPDMQTSQHIPSYANINFSDKRLLQSRWFRIILFIIPYLPQRKIPSRFDSDQFFSNSAASSSSFYNLCWFWKSP